MYPGYGRDPDEAVRRARVTLRASGSRQPVGAGVVVAEGYVLTCAHVVNAALGRHKMSTREPTPDDLASVALVLPGEDARAYVPRLVCWDAPVGCGKSWWEGDLALLRLPADAPPVPPVRLAPAEFGSTAWAWYADGDGRSMVDVVVQKPMGPWLVLDPGRAEVVVEPGYSGGPLWNSANSTLAGLIVGVEGEVRRYYAIGPKAVEALLLRAGLQNRAPARDPRQALLHRRLSDALAALQPDWYDRGAVRFAQALGLPPGPRTPEDTVDAALAHPRGLPALRDSFRGSDPVHAAVHTAVHAAARTSRGTLLAPADHAELHALLARVPMPELVAAARDAVPFLPLRADLLADQLAFIDHFEDRECDPGVMPPLLQVVEEIAARRAAHRAELREWSAQVAERLRVRDGALEQVRALARARAGSRGAARPVVRVWLWPHPRPDTYTYVIRLYDGDDGLLETWTADEPRGHLALCDDLARAVGRLADHDETAGVEFLIAEEGFGLPFDRWPVPTPQLGPRRLGIDRFVVVRGQQTRGRAPWERRWRSLGAEAEVVRDMDDADDLLGDDLDAAFVIAVCPADQVDRTVRLCRYYGVPVVLWHRQAVGDDAVRVLRDLVGGDGPRGLRETVRRRRFKARKDDKLPGAHLSLLWEDPRWAPADIRLSAPAPAAAHAAVPVSVPPAKGGAA